MNLYLTANANIICVSIIFHKKILTVLYALFYVGEQNAYLCGLITVCPIEQRRSRDPEENSSFHDNAYSYRVIVRNENGDKDTVVCYKALMSLHGISKKSMQHLQKYQKTTGMALKDQRGKYYHKHCSIPEEVTESIVIHISSFKGRQSGYSRKNSVRVYLPDTLNIKRMYEIYKEKNSRLCCMNTTGRSLIRYLILHLDIHAPTHVVHAISTKLM
ncbi:hypothetical protein PR048_029758 [Dryococelus australis]|uniref:Uncharacterized protein n=1 Tax=Dryococelus australis TaxID=614101 RepID=A0ABQ9G9T8_9NEOP|nr:hypothetical protein PR048_029758 [Dryococelus australis]